MTFNFSFKSLFYFDKKKKAVANANFMYIFFALLGELKPVF